MSDINIHICSQWSAVGACTPIPKSSSTVEKNSGLEQEKRK